MSPAATLYAVPKSRLRHSHRGRKSDRQRRKFGELAALVRRLPCCVEGCERGPSEAAHVKSRGAGGEAWIEVGGVEVGNPLVCAWRAGHQAIGCDVSERACEIAAKRLEAEMRQGRLTAPARAVEMSLFESAVMR